MGASSLTWYLGMHKHFRMIALSEHLRNNGYTTPNDEHTRIPGIWAKLISLYNLQALDERVGCIRLCGEGSSGSCMTQENSFGDDESEDDDSAKELFCPFRLPEDDFGEQMFNRRLAPDGSSSPSWLEQDAPDQNISANRSGSTAEDGESKLYPSSTGGI